MNRRDFLRRAALVSAGVVAADQLDLLDRLGWVRRFFPGWSASSPLTTQQVFRVVDQYGAPIFDVFSTLETPLIHRIDESEYRAWSTGRWDFGVRRV